MGHIGEFTLGKIFIVLLNWVNTGKKNIHHLTSKGFKSCNIFLEILQINKNMSLVVFVNFTDV